MVHLGVIVIGVGVAASSLFSTTVEGNLRPGGSLAINQYNLTFQGLQRYATSARQVASAAMAVTENGRPPEQMTSQKYTHRAEEVSMIVGIVAIVLAGGVFAAVGYPLLRDRREPAIRRPGAYDLALEDLVVQREEIYAAIKELDFDHEMGNLAEGDYQQLRERYRRKAAGILQELDTLQTAAASPAVRTRRVTKGGPIPPDEDEIEREVRRRRQGRGTGGAAGRSCGQCGGSVGPQDQFCAVCGTAVRAAGCPSCGTPHEPEDRFCAGCGSALVVGAAR